MRLDGTKRKESEYGCGRSKRPRNGVCVMHDVMAEFDFIGGSVAGSQGCQRWTEGNDDASLSYSDIRE